jgi:hypothetical protein
MNLLKKSMLLGGCVAALTLGATHTMAQRGGGDPTAFRERILESYHTRLEITNDADWNAISPLITKVMDAQREVMSNRMGGMFGGMGRGRRGGNGGESDNSTTTNSDRPRRGNPFEPSAAVAALQKAIEEKAPASELKAKMAAVRDEAKEKEAKLAAAQDELRGVLSTRQEAIAVAGGLLK